MNLIRNYMVNKIFIPLGYFGHFFYRTARSLGRRGIHIENTCEQTIELGIKSFMIANFTAIFVGMAFVLQTGVQLAKFGAKISVSGIATIASFQEMIPVFVSLIVGARIASAITAELGTMKVTEQIDAMEVMAIDPIHHLVIPRIIATTIMIPLLIIYSDLTGYLGGTLIGYFSLNINPNTYFNVAQTFVEFSDFYYGLIKSVCFGFLIGVIGTYYGQKTEGGARGVGLYTTYAVVATLISIVTADFFISNIIIFLERLS